jgi:hypothetical protein
MTDRYTVETASDGIHDVVYDNVNRRIVFVDYFNSGAAAIVEAEALNKGNDE